MTVEKRKNLMHWLVIAAMLLASVLMIWTLVSLKIVTAQNTATYLALKDEQQAAKDRGDEPVAPEADDLMDDPGSYTGGEASGVDEAQVRKLVKAAVREYLSGVDLDKDETITEADIIATVSNYLAENGVKVFGADLAKLVGDEVTKQLNAKGSLIGPQGEQGEKGDPGETGASGETGAQGERGPGPTAEEIGAAVEAFVADRGLPLCPESYEAQEADVLTTSGTREAILCVKM